MSRLRLGARNKVVQKMSKNGLVERDVTAGEEKRVSMRGVEYALRDKPPDQGYSQLGNTLDPDKRRKLTVQRGHAATQDADGAAQPIDSPRGEPLPLTEAEAGTTAIPTTYSEALSTPDDETIPAEAVTVREPTAHTAPPVSPSVSHKPPRKYGSGSFKTRESAAVFHQEAESALRHEAPPPDPAQAQDSVSEYKPYSPGRKAKSRPPRQTEPALRHETPQPDSSQPQENAVVFRHEDQSALHHESPLNPVPQPNNTRSAGRRLPRQENVRQQNDAPVAESRLDEAPNASVNADPAAILKPRANQRPPIPNQTPPAPERPSALQLTREESAPPPGRKRRIERAEQQLARSSEKLERAREKLPTKRKLRSETVMNETTGKAGRKLTFEKEVKSQREHIQGPLPLRPVKAGANAVIAVGHRKLYQAEHENVGTEAAHKVELLAENGVRSALRSRKTAPYRKVAKLERGVSRKAAKLSFEKAQAGNPALKRKEAARAMQRKKIKNGYAKAARSAGNLAKRAGTAAVDALKTAAAVITKHPAAAVIAALIIAAFFAVMSLVGLATNVGTSALSGYVTSAYLAENTDIENAELIYTVWETELREEIENIESDHPGYNEYEHDYDLDEIAHDPLELLAYLTAMYQDYTMSEIEADLRALFDQQYVLTLDETVETDGEEEIRVLTVTLEVTPLSEIIGDAMNGDQRDHYDSLMDSKGGRQYAGSPFAFDWQPYITCLYGWRPDPFTGESDYHTGVDIGIPTGTPVIAAHDGVVTKAEWGTTGYGRQIVIEGENGVSTRYAHCDSLLAVVGQTVEQGEVIAASGSTGYSTGPHLHYEVMLDGQQVNPIFFANTNSEMEDT